jgi:hypothetical protein
MVVADKEEMARLEVAVVDQSLECHSRITCPLLSTPSFPRPFAIAALFRNQAWGLDDGERAMPPGPRERNDDISLPFDVTIAAITWI